MKILTISALSYILLIIVSCSSSASVNGHHDFLECLAEEHDFANNVYTPTHPSYSSILKFPIWNLRFTSESTPKPQVIITPERESQIPPIILCAKENNLEIRVRSGGHDNEGVSSVSKFPFVIIDLINLSEVNVDVDEKTVWVEAGATIGSLCYRIAEKSPTLAFPAGFTPTVGVGGHISGGGYGSLMRKFGLASDNVLDARIVDVNGRILDRKSMGEDLFWAIRGGGGASFGVITAWKLQLVDIPEKVTVFTVQRTMEQNLTNIVHRWQYVAPTIDRDLYIFVTARRTNSRTDESKKNTISASFCSVFLGGPDRLLELMQESFPELGLVREDCIEMSWIQSVIYYSGYGLPIEPLDVLLNRTQPDSIHMKIKGDYVLDPLPEHAIEGIWDLYFEPEGDISLLYLVPYGGKMAEISESATPFAHRARYLYKIAHFAIWQKEDDENSDRYVDWVRRVYRYLTPYVSKSPRGAYINFRDLDIGVNNDEGETSYEQASIWGKKYFGNNFDRLVQVKSVVDPQNFFRQEQTIPPVWEKIAEQTFDNVCHVSL